ncbi:MAG: otsB [Herminiimonas sp.]|nr:otsB [Herminiimonas sp.]
MTLLFSEAGLRRLDAIVKPGVLCVFDFDGTLSPIVAQPERAHLPPDVLARLVELSKYAPVAIITGRSVEDIRARLDFEPDFVVGNHGLEGVPGWERHGQRYEAMCEAWKQALSAALQDETRFDPGIWIEDKRYSLSVHYRMTPNRFRTEARLAELFSILTPPARVIAGKCVFSLLPPDAADKGSAFEQLMQTTGAGSAIYVGDDVTDEDVFRLQRPDLLSVRIENIPGSAAEFFIHHRLDIVQLLDGLIARLRKLPVADATPPSSTDKL